MEQYAVDNNLIDKENIIKEEQATTTAENAYYSRIIVDNHDASNVHVITSKFHMERAKNIFEKVTFARFSFLQRFLLYLYVVTEWRTK